MKKKLLTLISLCAMTAFAERPRPTHERKPAPPSWQAYTLQHLEFSTSPEPDDIATVLIPSPQRGKFLSMLTTTNWPRLTGNMTRRTVNMTMMLDAYDVPPPVEFVSQWQDADWNTCPAQPSVRLFFTSVKTKYDVSDANSNPTHYWWAATDMGSWELTAVDNRGAFVSASISDPHQWTDALGRSAMLNKADFFQCVSNVAQLGLSAGGACFYDTGVAQVSEDGETVLHITGFEVY